jgi:hypothetical protein
MLSGVAIWALHFMAIYTFAALACARGFGGARWLGIPATTWVLGAFTAIALVAAAAVIVSTLRARIAGFAGWMTVSVAALAALAIAWEALPVLLVPPCA